MKLYALRVGMVGTNCYMPASDKGNAAIVDPGAEPERIAAVLAQHFLTPKMILLTHGHFDHIGAVDALRKKYNIPVYVHEDDAEMLSDSRKNAGIGLVGEHITAEYDHTVRDGDEIQLDELTFRVIHTPGHSKGGVCYQVEKVLLTGDTLFRGSMGRTDLYGGDPAELNRSLRKLGDLEGNYKVCPGHGPISTLDEERNQNPYMGKMSYDDII